MKTLPIIMVIGLLIGLGPLESQSDLFDSDVIKEARKEVYGNWYYGRRAQKFISEKLGFWVNVYNLSTVEIKCNGDRIYKFWTAITRCSYQVGGIA